MLAKFSHIIYKCFHPQVSDRFQTALKTSLLSDLYYVKEMLILNMATQYDFKRVSSTHLFDS